jgi:glycosyltransferase involved in cell wall biosynthesis
VRILQVISQLSDFMGDSGQVLLIAKILQNMGHQVEIVTTDGDPFFNSIENSERYFKTRKKLLESKGIIKINDIPVHTIHCTFPSLGMYSFEATKIAKKIIKNYDVIHVYSWYHHLGFVFASMANKYKIPFFVSMWGTLQPEAQQFHKNKKRLLDALYTKKMILHATGLHSIGESETKEYIKWGADKNKIHYIDNGIVLEHFKIIDKTKIFDKLDLKQDQNYLLYLGRIHEKKGIELLLKSFKKIIETNINILLIIAGTGEYSYVTEIKKFVETLGLENNVKFAGFVSHEEKLELLQHAKIFVLTSYNDIHPRAVQEALTVGTPVIITKVCDYPEVEQYNAGMTVDLDELSIYNALKNLLENDDKRRTMSSNAKNLIKNRFLLVDQVKKFEQVYLEAIKK